MGMCISYDRVIEVEDWIATSTCQRFREEGVVSPACLRKGLFTVGALDNIDHNLSATTSLSSSFHGTGISLFQFPTKEKLGESRTPVTIPPPNGAKHHSLPYHYAFVPAVALTTTKVPVLRFNIAPVLVSETIACSQLIKCCCKGDCSKCKCGKANLVCSPLCNCKCNEE